MAPDEHRLAMLRGYASMGLNLSGANIVNKPSGSILVSNGGSGFPAWIMPSVSLLPGGTWGRASKVKRWRKKMSVIKFIKFSGELVNAFNVNVFRINEPSNASMRWAVECDTDDDDSFEYFDSQEAALARLDELFTQLQG